MGERDEDVSLPTRKVRRHSRSHRRSFRPLRLMLWVAALLVILLMLDCGILYNRIIRFEGMSVDRAEHADVGIVLGASLWNDRPSPGLRERLDLALTLYEAGVYSRIIVTGGLDAGGATITEAEGMRNYLVENGVPADVIKLEDASRSTYENLKYAQRIMDEENWRTAVIVTHRYHGARAADIAAALGYEQVQVGAADTKVMNLAYHQARETLAFVKWQWTKLRLSLGV